MDSKIFLGKYRVAAEEMDAVGEIADSSPAYKAEEIDSGKKVVVEIVPAGSLKTAAREGLEAEAMAARKLSHVNIPALCDFGVEDDHLVYVTEDFDGTPAEEWVNAHGPMPVGPVLRIASQVLSALGAAAIHQINHHAINPSNLVLVPGQTAEGDWPLVKVLHFVGVAPKTSGTDVAVAAFDKSLHYASPEQIQKGTVDFRSELFSLGATMWFLLTGAPPLVAPAGPTATPSAKTGLAAEKIAAIPKKIRRLLAQMLAVNPEERPGDPLAFYRKLLDCLQQAERRETMVRRLGIPLFSPAGFPRRRRIPVKALALAALFLALTTVAAVVVSGYLRHGRVVRAEEPIGKPVGVPEASASATPVAANTNAIVSNTAPPTMAVAEVNSVQPAPPANAEPPPANTPVPSTESVEIASTTQVGVTPAPPAASDFPKVLESRDPAAVMANNAATVPDIADSPEVASSKQPEPTPVESPDSKPRVVARKTEPAPAPVESPDSKPRVVARKTEPAPAPVESPDSKPRVVARKTPPKKTIMHEVRRAEPAEDEPQARPAELAPPEEGPQSVASETITSDPEPSVSEKSPAKKIERPVKSKRQAERKDHSRERLSESEKSKPRSPADDEPQARPAENAPPEEGPQSAASETITSDSEPSVSEKSPAKKTEQAVKPKRQAERKDHSRERLSESERSKPRSPAGSRRARFLGVTPEGWWLLESPSGRVIVVPPPPSR